MDENRYNTRYLMHIHSIEKIHQIGRLLQLYKSEKDMTQLFGNGTITFEWNPESDYIFLVDCHFKIAMERDGELHDWIICPECNEENWADILSNSDRKCCIETVNAIYKKAA